LPGRSLQTISSPVSDAWALTSGRGPRYDSASGCGSGEQIVFLPPQPGVAFLTKAPTMSKSLTLTFDGKYDVLMRMIEAFSQQDLFEDEQEQPVQLGVDEIAMQMLVDGCMAWMVTIGSLPEELEQEFQDTFEMDDEDCDDEDCEDCGEECEDHQH
jgi:hypothetical protein